MSRKNLHDSSGDEVSGIGFRKKLVARILCAVGASAMIAQGCSSSSGGEASRASSSGSGGKPASSTSSTSGPSSSSSSSGHGGSLSSSAAAGGSDAGPDGAGGDGGGLDAGSGAGGSGGSTMATTRLCIPWPFPVQSDGGTDGGGTGGASGASSSSSTSGAGGSAVVDAGPCPTDFTVVLNDFLAENCPRGFEPKQIVDGPIMPEAPGACCYDTYLALCGPGGRPFIEEGLEDRRVARTADRIVGGGWRADEVRLDVADLTNEARAALAGAWAEDALREHASVPAFSRIALSLLALGAPADLVRETHEAALDEVRHAELSFGLAAAYAGADVAPSDFPLGSTVTLATTLEELALATIAEGCVGETIAAALAAEQLQHATDPAVRAVLTQIADDEAAHAELAWRTLAWAVREGGAAVAEVARAAFASVGSANLANASPAAETHLEQLQAHGRLDSATSVAVARDVTRGLILPSAAWLLARAEKSSRLGHEKAA